MPLPRPASPARLLADLRAFLANRQPHQLLFATIAIAIPVVLVVGFLNETRIPPRPPEIVYIQNWSPNRTDADIIAQQKQELAEKKAFQEEKKRSFKRLNDSLHGWL